MPSRPRVWQSPADGVWTPLLLYAHLSPEGDVIPDLLCRRLGSGMIDDGFVRWD
jgi:hypothetical protein